MRTGDSVDYEVYGYRWVILIVFAVLNLLIQLHWIAFASITNEASQFYRVTPLQIGFLSMLFMILYVVVCFPASYIIDTFGIRVGIGVGAVLTGIFGLLKGVFGQSFAAVCIAQVGLAVAQPFILNAYTKVGALWFPIGERATATGISSLSQYIGIIVGLTATPYLVKSMGIEGMLRLYGIASVIGAAIFLLFIREKPPTPPCRPGERERFNVREGLKHIFANRSMVYLLVVFFIGLGMFNAVTTWIEQILAPRGFQAEQAGLAGGLMMVGGVIGASILPVLSDRYLKRKPFLIACMILVVPGLIGFTLARSFWLLLASSFELGFFMMSAGPIGFQYGAEISYPAPESTSQGLILLSGQISGILFIWGMDAFRGAGGSMTPFLIVLIVLTVLNIGLASGLKESTLIAPEKRES